MTTQTTAGTRYPMQFTGKGWQYFKIWIVNILLTIVTLYIYSAWAKVRSKRYFYGNTILDNSTFEYHAKGSQIILGRIAAVILLILASLSGISLLLSGIATALIFILLPWAIWRSLMFNARMSSYRNVRFGYTGPALPLYGLILLLPFLPLFAFAAIAALAYFGGRPDVAPQIVIAGVFATYAFSPWVHRASQNHVINQHRFGTAGFRTVLLKRTYYAAYIMAFFIWMLIMLLALAVVAAIAIITGVVSEESMGELQGMLEGSGETFPTAGFWVMGVSVYLLLFVAGFLAIAYLRAKLRRHTFERTSLDSRVALESTVRTWPLFWIMFSNALLVIGTLGLGYPWIKVRMARYMANNTVIHAEESLDHFVNAEKEKLSALGEELGDAFDMDMDVGF